VRVDGVLYSRAEYEEHFGHLDLHWVVNDAARARGILIAFTTEENRNAALRSQRDAGSQPEAVVQDVRLSDRAKATLPKSQSPGVVRKHGIEFLPCYALVEGRCIVNAFKGTNGEPTSLYYVSR
jgi:hypothetical protein